MTRTNRFYVRMVSLSAALFALIAAVLAYHLTFDWLSTIIFTVLAAPNLYFYIRYLYKEAEIARSYRFINAHVRSRCRVVAES